MFMLKIKNLAFIYVEGHWYVASVNITNKSVIKCYMRGEFQNLSLRMRYLDCAYLSANGIAGNVGILVDFLVCNNIDSNDKAFCNNKDISFTFPSQDKDRPMHRYSR